MAANNCSDVSLWLGIDLGTTSVKVALVNSQGDVIQHNSCPTEAEVQSDIGSTGYEQDPIKILNALQDLILPVMEHHKDNIKGIGITGQMHGVVMWRRPYNHFSSIESLDKLSDVNCSNLYTWQDQRCTSEFLESLPRPSSSHQPLSTGHGCATVFWLTRCQPTFFKDGQFTCCGTIMDFLAAVLCNLDHPVTSDQLAASFGYFNKTSLSWDSVLEEDENFPNHLLPKIVPAGTIIGHVRSTLTGWPSGVPVFVSMGDVQCAMFATLKDPSDAAVNISTSVQVGFIIPATATDSVREDSPASISFFPYLDGRLLALCAGLNGGNAISHFVVCIVNWISQLGLNEHLNTTSLLNQLQTLAEECKEDTSPLTVRPVFFGERHHTELCGHISGLNSVNFKNIGAVFRAVCEGVIDHLNDMVPAKYLISQGISRLLVSGSVPMNNQIIRQRLKLLYSVGSDLNVVIDEEGTNAVSSAVGAARVIQNYVQSRY